MTWRDIIIAQSTAHTQILNPALSNTHTSKPTQALKPVHAGTNKKTQEAHTPVSKDPPKEMQESTVTSQNNVHNNNKIKTDQIDYIQ